MVGYAKRIGNKNTFIGVSLMPHRKKLCLVVREGNCVTKYATFNNEESAYEFMDIFADFIGAKRIEWAFRGENE